MLLNNNYISSLSEAVFSYFKENNKLSTLVKDIKNLHQILETKEGKKLLLLLDNLLLSRTEKSHLIQKIFKSQIDQTLVYFLTLTIEVGCEGFLEQILGNVIKIYKKDLKAQTVFFESYFPMTQEKAKKYIFTYFPNLQSLYQQKLITIDLKINKDLLGGFKIKVGDNIIDNSFLFSLNKLTEHLKSN